MKTKYLPAIALALFAAVASHAAAPANAPAGSTGLCKDGTYHDGAEKKGACRGHQGVKEWWGPAKDAKASAKADAKADAKTDAKAADAKPEAKAAAPATPPAATATATAAPAATAPAAVTATAKPVATAPAATTAPAAAAKMPAKPDTLAAAPGGGAGMVWVNESSKVYHCQGDKWYGKTKQGEYLKEADAKAKGAKPAGGKACAA